MTALVFVDLAHKITVLVAFALLTVQIYLSTSEKYFKLHRIFTNFTYIFIFMYPVLIMVSRYLSLGKIDPFYLYTDICIICSDNYEYYINFGRISFYLVTITFFSSKFNLLNKWLKINSRQLYVLNYFAFYFISVYIRYLFQKPEPIIVTILFWVCQVIVLSSIIIKFRKNMFK